LIDDVSLGVTVSWALTEEWRHVRRKTPQIGMWSFVVGLTCTVDGGAVIDLGLPPHDVPGAIVTALMLARGAGAAALGR
jgi:hypothetical protein